MNHEALSGFHRKSGVFKHSTQKYRLAIQNNSATGMFHFVYYKQYYLKSGLGILNIQVLLHEYVKEREGNLNIFFNSSKISYMY